MKKQPGNEATREREALIKRMRTFLLDRAEVFRRVLPESIRSVEAFVDGTMFNVARSDTLPTCSPESVFQAALAAAKLGLEPDQTLGHAYLLPFHDSKSEETRAQLVIGYRGMARLAWRDAKIIMRGAVVRAKDGFVWEDGLEQRLVHQPSPSDDPGDRVGAWIVATLPDGRKIPKFCPKREILEARGFSRGADDPWSPWQTNPDSMWLKTPVRRMWPLLPVSAEVSRVVEAVEANDPIAEAAEFVESRPAAAPTDEATAPMSFSQKSLMAATDRLRSPGGSPTKAPVDERGALETKLAGWMLSGPPGNARAKQAFKAAGVKLKLPLTQTQVRALTIDQLAAAAAVMVSDMAKES